MFTVRHQHQKSAGNGDIGSDPCAFGADGSFDHLHQDFHTGFKDIGDILQSDAGFAAGKFGGIFGIGIISAFFGFFSRCRGSFFCFFQLILFNEFRVAGEHLPVVEKGVFLGADIHKSCLQRGVQIDDAAEINISGFGGIVIPFDLILFQFGVVAQQSKSPFQFFAVEYNFFGHK